MFHHIETSQLICRAKQVTGFYMMGTWVVKPLIRSYMTINLVLGKNHSTDICLFFLNDKTLKGFGDGLVNGMVFIDPQEAFDAIKHGILLKKLSIIGFPDHIVKWFQSYLSNRKLTVNLENSFFRSFKHIMRCATRINSWTFLIFNIATLAFILLFYSHMAMAHA